MSEEKTYTPILDALAKAAPEPFAELKRKRLVPAIKATEADWTTRNGFVWPFPGEWATCSAPDKANEGACPRSEGDGLCVAKTMSGAAQGGHAVRHLLIVGYRKRDVLGQDSEKVRVVGAYVAGIISIERMARESEHLDRANLDRANLYGANLNRASLYGANLYGANLYGANLNRASLYGANLYGASLDRANLNGANLNGAYLDGANLSRANLNGAYLDGASLNGALALDDAHHVAEDVLAEWRKVNGL